MLTATARPSADRTAADRRPAATAEAVPQLVLPERPADQGAISRGGRVPSVGRSAET